MCLAGACEQQRATRGSNAPRRHARTNERESPRRPNNDPPPTGHPPPGTNKQIIDQLNDQIDFLNAQLADHEHKLASSSGAAAAAAELRAALARREDELEDAAAARVGLEAPLVEARALAGGAGGGGEYGEFGDPARPAAAAAAAARDDDVAAVLGAYQADKRAFASSLRAAEAAAAEAGEPVGPCTVALRQPIRSLYSR